MPLVLVFLLNEDRALGDMEKPPKHRMNGSIFDPLRTQNRLTRTEMFAFSGFVIHPLPMDGGMFATSSYTTYLYMKWSDILYDHYR